MLKTLVYTTAFGKQYFLDLAEQSLLSLRRRGYTGDIAVLSDRPCTFPSWMQVRVCILPGTSGPRMFKAAMPPYMVASAYDRVLYIDSDVVFLRNPLPLFSLGESKMAISTYHHYLSENKFNQSHFSRDEKIHPRLSQVRAVNTGIMVFPGFRLDEYMRSWNTQWLSSARKRFEANQRSSSSPLTNRAPTSYLEMDQPALQALLFRGMLDYEEIPDILYHMPLFYTENLSLHPSAVALHLCGGSRLPHQKSSLVKLMREFVSMDEYAEFRETCARIQRDRDVLFVPER